MCGAGITVATNLTLPSFASAGGSDLENWWDRKDSDRSPRMKHDSGRILDIRNPQRQKAFDRISLIPSSTLFWRKEHVLWL